MRLNLGCGGRKLPGYVNVDLPGNGAEVECDIRKLPYEPGSCDEILALHVLEHLYRHDAIAALRDWTALLKPGGLLVMELPCLDKVLMHFAHGAPPHMTTMALYGKNPEGIDALQHKWCWRRDELIDAFRACGLVDVKEQPCQFHVPARDMRIVGTKR